MTPVELTITRPHEGEWHALDGALDVGVAYAMHRPDQRWFITLDSWRDDAYHPLLAAVTCDSQQDLYITVNDSDYEQLDRCRMLGFTVSRREDEYRVPTDPAITGLGEARFPPGLHAVSAADTDVNALRLLDDLLREDIPGADGWVNDPREFRSTPSTLGTSTRTPTSWPSMTPRAPTPGSCACGTSPASAYWA